MNLVARHITFSYSARHEPPREVFRDVTLEIPSGQCVGMLGREGSGKTTLIGLLGGLVPPAGGTVRIDGKDPHKGRDGRDALRLRMGFTFQFPDEQFFRPTVEEEFQDLLRLRGVRPAEVPERMERALASLELDPVCFARRSPFSLSLGESRRCALALLLAIEPDAAFLDEPTSGLDASGALSALRVIRELHGKGATVIIATHDVNLLAETAGRVLLLGHGGIAADGKAADLLTDAALLAEHGYVVPEVVSLAAVLHVRGKTGERPLLRLDDLLASQGRPAGSSDNARERDDGDQ